MGFLGYADDYEEYKKNEKSANIIGTSGNIISCDNLPELDPKDYKLIKEVIIHNETDVVYMQSNPDFYDSYYNQETDDSDEDSYFMEDVKGIRRIYKNYTKFLNAQNLRDRYMRHIINKHGGEYQYQMKLQMGLVTDWIPPIPILASSCPDYKFYLNGIIPPTNDWDDERILEILEDQIKHCDIPPEDIEIRMEVLTDPVIIDQLINGNGVDNSGGIYCTASKVDNSFNGVTTGDLSELQTMIKSWLTPEEKETSKDIDIDLELFPNSEEAIKARFYTRPIVDAGGLARAMDTGEIDSEDEEDLDEMVLDNYTKRPMTRKELKKREFIRHLGTLGWNELRLMKLMSVGSNYELGKLEREMRNNARNKKKASKLMYDVIGENLEEISSLDELNEFLFD